MPFGDYRDFQDCLDKNKDKSDPYAYCGAIKHKIEKDQMEGIDDKHIEDALTAMETIDNEKESGKITQEEHDIKSKKILEELEESKSVKSPIQKAMHSRVGKKRVVMTRADGIRQHYFMNPEDIKRYREEGKDVQEIPEGREVDKEKTVAVDFDGTIVTLENPDVLQAGAKEGLQEIADMGYTIIIFSGRGTKDLEARLAKLGIDTYDYINDNPEERQENPGKVVADKFLDDRAVKFTNWKDAVKELKGDNMEKQVDIEEEEDPGENQEMMGDITKVPKEKPNLHRQSPEEWNEESEEIPPKTQQVEKSGTARKMQMDGYAKRLANQKGEKKPEEVKKEEEYPYIKSHLEDILKILDKCPKTKDLSKEGKIKILQDTINNINPKMEEYMKEIKKEDSPVAPAAPAPKDPLAEIKELIAGLTQKIGAMEGHMSKYDPSYGRGVDGKAHGAPEPQDTEVQHPGEDGAVDEDDSMNPMETGGVNKEDIEKAGRKPLDPVVAMRRNESSSQMANRAKHAGTWGKKGTSESIEKAEPIKTLPVYQGQKKQEDKELGPDKVSGAQYLNKEDIDSIVETAISSFIKKSGFTETPKARDPVAHPLEKADPSQKFDMASIASMKYESINEIAERLHGVRV